MISIPFNTDAVILANGDFPTHHIPLTVLKSADYLVCCDLAGETAIEHGLKPDAIVGDCDSLPKEFQHRYADILHHVTEQEYNDLTKATRYAKSLGKKRIAYVGATGKREDHTLSNISLMAYYHRELGIHPIMITDYGYFLIGDGHGIFDTFPRQQVSIFNVNCNRLESKGLKWQSYPYKELWQGSLNEATGNKTEFFADGIYLVFFTFDAKE